MTVSYIFSKNEYEKFGQPLSVQRIVRDENGTVIHTETLRPPPMPGTFEGLKPGVIFDALAEQGRIPAPVFAKPKSEELPAIYVAVDLETTGLDSTRHGTIQIGAVASNAKSSDMIDYFVSYAFPSGAEYDDGAMKVNQIPMETIGCAPPLDMVIVRFENWLSKLAEQGKVHLVFQNAPFDVDFLKRAGMVNSKNLRRVLDTASLGFAVFGEVMSLKRLAETLGIPNDGPSHDAFYDANLTLRVFHDLNARLDDGYVRKAT